MAMKKTDLYKNLALATAQRMKNSTKAPKLGTAEAKAKTKKELASTNPLLASLMGGVKDKASSAPKAKASAKPKTVSKSKAK
jgi:hypothetical protein